MTGDSKRASFLEDHFPELRDRGYRVTSEINFEYNCIAWAAGDSTRWWWPTDAYWPDGVRRELAADAFVEAYATIGYVVCESVDYEPGYEKIAIFADEGGETLHAARQLDAEYWTSKCGDLQDISHPLQAFEGTDYGSVTRVMKRRIRSGSHGDADLGGSL